MGDTAELIARLKYEAANRDWVQPVLAGMLRWAADAISSLVRERDEAREAAYDQPHGPTSRILWSTRYRELLDDYKDTEQVERLTRERDDALATISLLQSQHRKQQEHDTAIIEGLTCPTPAREGDMKDRETFRKMARELSADSIVMDALARYTEQVIEAAGTVAFDSQSVRETKALHAIMLVAEGGCAVVKIEIGGQWIELIRESLDGPFSHIIEPSGIDRRASEASLLSNTSEVGKDE